MPTAQACYHTRMHKHTNTGIIIQPTEKEEAKEIADKLKSDTKEETILHICDPNELLLIKID